MNLEIKEELLKRVDSINNKFSVYKNFSPDELRKTLRNIESSITSSEDVECCLDNYLEDVFAIVKATAYFFSKGCIEVEANENDFLLAGTSDFVQIKGGKAIYLNKWEAGGEKFTWKMVHYDEQLLGGIYLHKGYAVEMATGEGKTLVATLPIMLNALTHNGVHIMTVNDYLSKRDFEITRPLYMFHGLSVGCIELYGTHSSRRKLAYKSDITFGTNSEFTFDYLYDHMSMSPDDIVQSGHNFAIVDELDSVMIDNADEPHIVSGGQRYNVGETYKEYKPIFEELYSSESNSEMFVVDKLSNTAYYTDMGKQWIAEKIGINDLYSLTKKYQLPDYKSLSIDKQQEINRKLHIQNVFSQFLNAYALYEKDVDYIVEMGRVIIVDQHTGRTKESSRWEHGLHTAIEVKENVAAKSDSDGMAVISLKNYFRLYNKCSGMSGTIMTVAEELKQVYGLHSVSIPTHAPRIRKDLTLKVYKTKKSKDKAIVKEIQSLKEKKRPILVGSISIMRTHEVSQLLNNENISHIVLDAKSEEKEAAVISQAGKENSITLSTSMAGRGTDIKLSSQSKELGGLAVIGTDLFESSRVDQQLKGRAGRQGDPGSSQFFCSLDDFIVGNLSKDDKNALIEESSRIDNDDISTPRIIGYMLKAQENREKYFYKQRQKTALKDDIIAPHRRKFYEERNSVLMNSQVANSLIASLVSNHTSEADIITSLHDLYNHAIALVSVSQSNNKVRTKISIPFSDSLHLYSATFEISNLLKSFEYFCEEYKRQVILQAYDKYWKRFVVHMMADLDETEIASLEKEYSEMKYDIDCIIISRMMNATIPVGGVGEVTPIDTLQETTENNTPRMANSNKSIMSNELCPCGSGKSFGECHGQNTHQTIFRKRRR